MKVSQIKKLNFKGYDAAPLKNVYMHCASSKNGVFNEMKTVADKENFNLLGYFQGRFIDFMPDNYHQNCMLWAQDDKFFTEEKSKPKLLLDKEECASCEGFASALEKKKGIKTETPEKFLAGGNMFMGKNEKGEKWLLVGIDEIIDPMHSSETSIYQEMEQEKAINKISKIYNVKPENITILKQPNYHLDMAIRPIGYPYILVNDSKLVLENIRNNKKLFPEYIEKTAKEYYGNMYRYGYANCDETIKQLEGAGFKPIRIAGDWAYTTTGINYMNALVNKHNDGTFSYITNSTRHTRYEELDEMFEKDLRRVAKNLDKIHFVSGKPAKTMYIGSNGTMDTLKRLNGGIHCMSLEEPDFKKWGANENK